MDDAPIKPSKSLDNNLNFKPEINVEFKKQADIKFNVINHNETIQEDKLKKANEVVKNKENEKEKDVIKKDEE